MKVILISNSLIQTDFAFNDKSFTDAGYQVNHFRGNLLSASQRIAQELPEVVVVESSETISDDFALVEHYKMQYKSMTFMLMTDRNDSDVLLNALRAGFNEVILLPLTLEKLKQALDRFAQKRASRKNQDCKVYSFISSKGGSGATFVATNFAYVLASVFKKRVLLIDINQYFGDAVMYVSDKKNTPTLAELCLQINRLDKDLLDASLVDIIPNFKILPASESPESANDVKPEDFDKIIRLAKDEFDYIVLDACRQIDAVTLKALDMSGKIFVVTQLLVPYIRNAKLMLGIFSSLGYGPEKLKTIVNRFDSHSSVKLSDIRGIVAEDSLITVPNEYVSVRDSVNQGVSIYSLSNKNPVSQALIEMAIKVSGEKLPQARASFFSKLFK